jgi:hypothetical protein
MADSRIFGTLTKKEAEVLREFLRWFIQICPDADNKIDPADRKRIARVKKTFDRRHGLTGAVNLAL